MNAADIDAISFAIRSADNDATFDPIFDLNNDSLVDALDIDYLVETVLNTRRGDTNLDGKIDFVDFLALSANFGEEDKTWAEGNFGIDTLVNFDDFLVLSENFG